MTEPQVWTLIGVFAAGMFGTLTLMSTMFVRVLRAEIGTVRGEIGSLRSEVKGEIGSLRSEVKGEIAGLRAEMNSKFESLDRDVQLLMRRQFGIDDD